MAMTYASLAADIPVRLMAQNRAWPSEIANTIRKGQERLLLGIHPDFLREETSGDLDLAQDDAEEPTTLSGTIDLSGVAHLGEIQTVWLLRSGARRRVLLPKAYDYCMALYSGTGNDLPKYYAEHTRGVFEVFPAPDIAYEWHAIANLQADLITADHQENLLTQRLPTLLEYACCIEGALWMKDQSAIAIWQAAYDELLLTTNDNIRRRRRDETTPTTRKTENAGGAK